jgi:hypothetical protein
MGDETGADSVRMEEVRRGNREQSQQLAAAIEARCRAHGIPVTIKNPPFGAIVEIELPSGRERRRVIVGEIDRLQALLDMPFEKYVIPGEFLALCSYEDGTIEAIIESVGTAPARRILTRRLENGEGGVPSPLLSLSNEGLTVTVDGLSRDIETLFYRGMGPAGAQAALALKISGLTVDRHEVARDTLEAVANSLFLEVDTAFGLPLILSRVRRFQMARRHRQRGAEGLRFPANEYDPQPMALYWYGRGATGMPLLRFLAFYQVLEFYFPIYADHEIRRRVKSVVKDPGFKPHNEGHISKIMKAMNSGGRSGFGDERSQLRAAIRGSANPDVIRDFLDAGERRAKYFGERKRKHSPAVTLLRSGMDDDALLDAVAERIYEIRCRIVHSKDSEGDLGQLLPFSPEAEQMSQDIALVEALARGALVAGSRELRF